MVGIDVFKGKSVVSVLCPFEEVVAMPFAVVYTGSELKELANYLKCLDSETRVAMSTPDSTAYSTQSGNGQGRYPENCTLWA